MSEGYGEHCERLAGYGVGSGELRDYEPFSLEDAETVEANTREGQTGHVFAPLRRMDGGYSERCRTCGRLELEHGPEQSAVNVAPSSSIPEDAEETNLSGMNGSRDGVINVSRNSVTSSAGSAQNIPIDGGESLTEWLNEVERNQCENEREVEQQAWRDQELLQDETDNT